LHNFTLRSKATQLYDKIFDIDYYAILIGFCKGMLATPDNTQ